MTDKPKWELVMLPDGREGRRYADGSICDQHGWWPECPYPEDIFPMQRSEYAKIVPDPDVRTALSGMLGRLFWNIASEAIFEAWQEQQEELGDLDEALPLK